jgi:hypothetical protein
MSGSVLSGEVCIDLFVIDPRCIAKVYFSEVALEAFPRCLFLRFGALRPSIMPFADIPILPLKGGGNPLRGRRSGGFCMVADRSINFIAEVKGQRLAHLSPPPIL